MNFSHQFKIVPWICKEEWLHCRLHLFGVDLSMKKKALTHLEVWENRSKLPKAIECTRILMETLTLDESNEESHPSCKCVHLQLMYSMAIIRFLNLITDSKEKERFTSTMYQVAEKLNIPQSVVELRHSAAHGQSLPHISALRLATKQALSWIYDKYWSQDDKYQDEIAFGPGTNIDKCLNIYKAYIYDKTVARETLADYFQIYEPHKFSNDISDEKLGKILQKRLLKMIGKQDDSIDFCVSGLFRNCFPTSKNVVHVEDSVMANDFIEHCIRKNSPCTQQLIYGWLCELMKNAGNEANNHSRRRVFAMLVNAVAKRLQKLKSGKRVVLTARQEHVLMTMAIREPHPYTKMFLKSILNLTGTSIRRHGFQKLVKAIDIYTNVRKTRLMLDRNKMYTLKNLSGKIRLPLPVDPPKILPKKNDVLLKFIKRISKKNSDQLEVEKTDVQGDNVDWGKIPIGLTSINQKPWLHLYE